jgi:putative peptidoglycan lipid II flippase
MRSMLVVVAPAAAAYLVLAQPVVAVLVRGGFSVEDAHTTADTLQLMAIGLVPFSVYLYALRGFYSLQDTRTPFFVNVFENACNVALAIALFAELGVQGLALAHALSYVLASIVALVLLHRRIGGLGARVVVTGARATASAGLLAIVAAPVAGAIGAATAAEAALAAVAAGVAGAVAYVAAMRLLGASELAAFRSLLRRPTVARTGRVQR